MSYYFEYSSSRNNCFYYELKEKTKIAMLEMYKSAIQLPDRPFKMRQPSIHITIFEISLNQPGNSYTRIHSMNTHRFHNQKIFLIPSSFVHVVCTLPLTGWVSDLHKNYIYLDGSFFKISIQNSCPT